MLDVVEQATAIVAREGGFVNDPNDPGGATKHGVTIGTMRRLGLDLDDDGDVDVHDVHLVTPERARDLYLDHYYRRPRIHQLPEQLQPAVFDMYVNSGSNAVRILQRLLNRMGATLVVDGAIGPLTVRTAHRAAERLPDGIADAYGIERREWYYALADRRPSSRRYVRRRDGGKAGWIVRAEEFISPRYRFTEAQHRARVAHWN